MKKQNLVIASMIGFPCSVMLFSILFASLWEYRVWVGLSLLILIFLVVGVYVRGLITEQNLRLYRFHHREETPLDQYGEVQVLRPDMREHPNRFNGAQHYYQGYPQSIIRSGKADN